MGSWIADHGQELLGTPASHEGRCHVGRNECTHASDIEPRGVINRLDVEVLCSREESRDHESHCGRMRGCQLLQRTRVMRRQIPRGPLFSPCRQGGQSRKERERRKG